MGLKFKKAFVKNFDILQMPEIKAFKGLIYNPALPIEKLVAPPYDVISEKEQDELYKLHEYNVVRLILNRDEDRYGSAKRYFEEWLKDGVIIERDKEAIYIYEQTFEVKKRVYTRTGIICLMKLEKFGEGKIFPHEKTLPKPKEDRFNLLKSTNAQFDHIFGIYPDPDFRIEKILNEDKEKQLLFDFEFPTGSGIRHKLYEVSGEKINNISLIIKDKPVFIADGHHRYETALMFREFMASISKATEEHDYVLTYLTNMDSEGLIILPTHRVLINVSPEIMEKKIYDALIGYFDLEMFSSSDELQKFMEISDKGVFGVYAGGNKFWALKIRKDINISSFLPSEIPEPVKKLDVTILHEFVFKIAGLTDVKLTYTHDFITAVELAEKFRGTAIFLNPPSILDVKEVSLSGATMPQKSTYFFPKLLSGIVMRKF